MDRIQTQFTKLTQILFDPKTIESYQTVLGLTWNILKETALLFWLTFCSVFVLAAWVGDNAIQTGRDLRAWVNQQSNQETDSSEKAVAVGQALLDAGQNGANYLLNQAREQLGLEKLDRPVKVTQPVVPSAPVAKKAPEISTAPEEPTSVATPPKSATADVEKAATEATAE